MEPGLRNKKYHQSSVSLHIKAATQKIVYANTNPIFGKISKSNILTELFTWSR